MMRVFVTVPSGINPRGVFTCHWTTRITAHQNESSRQLYIQQKIMKNRTASSIKICWKNRINLTARTKSSSYRLANTCTSPHRHPPPRLYQSYLYARHQQMVTVNQRRDIRYKATREKAIAALLVRNLETPGYCSLATTHSIQGVPGPPPQGD